MHYNKIKFATKYTRLQHEEYVKHLKDTVSYSAAPRFHIALQYSHIVFNSVARIITKGKQNTMIRIRNWWQSHHRMHNKSHNEMENYSGNLNTPYHMISFRHHSVVFELVHPCRICLLLVVSSLDSSSSSCWFHFSLLKLFVFVCE